ncbi:glycosyltransferase family 2 protein [Candidatus Beckwithbacteria bacterium]|nr:glycosyltransferase family 2 protein [Candidatus Beckwithbacteria bacterium]
MDIQTKKDQRLLRFLEIVPGFVSWSLILFPIWGSLLIPVAVAYYILAFDVYWLYRSLSLGILATLSYFKIKAFQKYDWMRDVKDFGDWQKVQHIVIIPNYCEPQYILERTLDALVAQTFPTKNIHIVLGFEEREGPEAQKKYKTLKQKYGKKFANFIGTFHPVLEGEVVGKSSNMAWASKVAKKEIIDKQGFDIDYCTISSEDVDARFNEQYFATLTYKFLDDPKRYERFWQPAILYYNNIWDIPAPIRVFATNASIVQIGMLNRKDRLINFSTYSTSLKLIDRIGYWDTDVIPEDYRLFFKAYFKTDGKVSVEPIFLPVHADAANSRNFKKTMVNQYEQVKRWAWGTSDDPYIIMQWLKAKQIPFWDKTIRVLKVVEDHFLWPVNWFAITIGATLPPLLNPDFARTVIGKSLPQTSSAILTVSLLSMLLIIVVDFTQRPGKKEVKLWKKLLTPFEYILLPVVGFFFSALPGLDAHTRLMLGRYIEYRVTEKV